MDILGFAEIDKRRRRARRLEGWPPERMAALFLGLAAQSDAWAEARLPGFIAHFGPGWRDRLRELAAQLLWP
jgi:hypothetical protein